MATTKTIFDESKFHLIEAYIQNGSKSKLEDDEVLYLDVLCKMNSMRRKYGLRETVKFFTNPYSSFMPTNRPTHKHFGT